MQTISFIQVKEKIDMKKFWIFICKIFQWLREKRRQIFPTTEEQVNDLIEEIKAAGTVEKIVISDSSLLQQDDASKQIIKKAIENTDKDTIRVATPYVKGPIRNFSKAHPGRHTVYGGTPKKIKRAQ